MLLDEDTVTTVDLEMRGTMIDLAMLDKDYIRVTVDLSNVSRTGVQTVTSVIYGYTEEYFRQNVTVSDRTPSTITINVAELYHKTVDVRCEITGNVAEGYSAGEIARLLGRPHKTVNTQLYRARSMLRGQLAAQVA